jgi:hypothetical protein
MSAPYTVDPADVARAGDFTWHKTPKGYLRTNVRFNGRNTTVSMHRFLFGSPLGGKVWDHINGDPSDNRRANVRLSSLAENGRNRKVHCRNTSGTTGVRKWGKGRWRAVLTVAGRPVSLGLFDNIEDAKAARLAGELRYFGAFSPSLSRAVSA